VFTYDILFLDNGAIKCDIFFSLLETHVASVIKEAQKYDLRQHYINCKVQNKCLFKRDESFTLQILSTCTAYVITFLGAFAKLRKATISFDMSVYPPVRIEQLGSD